MRKDSLQNMKLVHVSVCNVQVFRFYAKLKFNVMKKLFAIIAALVLVALVIDLQAQNERKKEIKKVIVNDEGEVTTTTDTIEMDVDFKMADEDGLRVLKFNGDSLIKFKMGDGEHFVWVDEDTHNQVIIKRLHHGDSDNVDVMIERIIGENEDSLEQEVKVHLQKLKGDSNHRVFFGDELMVPPPPPPVPGLTFRKFNRTVDPLQEVLDDPEYEVIRFEKKIKKGIEFIEIERKKK